MTAKPKFEATINLGHVLTMVSFAIGGMLAYANVQVSIAELSLKMDNIAINHTELKQFTDRELREIRTRLRDVEQKKTD